MIISGKQIDVDMRETLKALVTASVFYWVGSSRGSAAKDERSEARPQPTAVATTGTVNVTNDRANGSTPVGNDDDDSAGRNRRRQR